MYENKLSDNFQHTNNILRSRIFTINRKNVFKIKTNEKIFELNDVCKTININIHVNKFDL